MDWANIAPMVVGVTAIITMGGVAVLRPLSKRIAGLMEFYANDRRSGIEGDVGQIRDLLETMDARLQLMEERQDFTERLLSSARETERSLQPSDSEQVPAPD
jgi:hypothetical protein